MRRRHLSSVLLFGLLSLGGYSLVLGQGSEQLYLPSVQRVAAPDATGTATPTSTATSTPTTTPTATNTPTPTPTSTDVPIAAAQVRDNWSWYTDNLGGLNVVGEAQNTGNVNLSFVEVTARLLDAQGGTLAESSRLAINRVIEPGQKSCFRIIFSSPPPVHMIASISLNVADFVVGGRFFQGLTILGANGGPVSGGYQITGLVRNDGTTIADDVTVAATIYAGPGGTGTVLGCHPDLNSPVDLPPGEDHSFLMQSPGLSASAVGSFVVEAQSVIP